MGDGKGDPMETIVGSILEGIHNKNGHLLSPAAVDMLAEPCGTQEWQPPEQFARIVAPPNENSSK